MDWRQAVSEQAVRLADWLKKRRIKTEGKLKAADSVPSEEPAQQVLMRLFLNIVGLIAFMTAIFSPDSYFTPEQLMVFYAVAMASLCANTYLARSRYRALKYNFVFLVLAAAMTVYTIVNGILLR